MADTERITILVDGEPTQIDAANPLTLLVHNQDMLVQFPDRIEIGVRETTYHAERVVRLHEMTELWYGKIMEPSAPDPVAYARERIRPIDERHLMSPGALHCLGLVDLSLKLVQLGHRRLGFHYPETHLHPKSQAELADFFRALAAYGDGLDK